MSTAVVQQFVEVLKNNCTEEELANIQHDLKQRNLSLQDGGDIEDDLEELFQKGKISKDNTDILEILTEKYQNKDLIKSRLRYFKDPKKEHVLGRTVQIQELLRELSENNVHGINLHGESGIGKTTLAKEIMNEFTAQNWERFVFDLREVTHIGQLYLGILNTLGLTILFRSDEMVSDDETAFRDLEKSRIVHFLKEKCADESKILLLFDNIEDNLVQDHKEELNNFIEAVNELESCKDGRLKIITTSTLDISSKFLKSENIKPLSKSSSKELMCRSYKFDSLEEQPQSDNEKKALDKLAEYCNNIPYLLERVEQMMRDRFISPVELLSRLEEQKNLGVSDEYLVTSLLFNSIPQDNLKKLAVKVCIFPKIFTASNALEIAQLKSLYDAKLDLEILVRQKVLEKNRDETSVTYDVHNLFKIFSASFLRIKFPDVFEEEYKQAEFMFVHHYLRKLRNLAENVVENFTETFQEIRKDEFNFDVALESPIFKEQLLPLSSDETLCRVIMIFEPLKSISNRRKLFKTWADALEQKGNFLTSSYMRCWQSIQLADMEGTVQSEQILKDAEECFKRVSNESSMSVRYAAVKSLLLYCKGKLKCMKSAHLDSKKHKKVKVDLILKAREELMDSLMIFQDVYSERALEGGDHIMAVRALNVLGNCSMELDDPETAEGYYKQALEMKLRLTKENEKHSEIPTFYNQLSQVYQMLGDKESEKFSFRGLVGLGDQKAKKFYEEAVLNVTKAIELNKELGLEDTLGTATFNRNLANIFIALKGYEEALECAKKSYEVRKKLLDKHPETVRILYLMGVINEWREDRAAALLNYEEAFKIEEKLPKENHSLMKNRVCDRLEAMCIRRKERRKLREYSERIKRLRKLKVNIEIEEKQDGPELKQDFTTSQVSLSDTYSSLSKEVTVNVMEKGGTYDYSVNGFVLFFPENCVSGPARIKCETNPSIPSPSNAKEHLVSSVIRLGSVDLNLRSSFVMTMLHCGPGMEDGFEVKVKVFNERKQLWEDHEDSQQATTPAVDFHTKYFTISLTRLTAVAVVTRLITNILEVPPSGCEIRLSVCPSITIRFPEGAVDTQIKGELQVLPIPDHLVQDSKCIPCPILLFNGFKGVIFKKPVSICSTITDISLRVRLLRLDDTRNSPFLWEDITEDIKKPTIKDNTVELQVQRFCGLWTWFSTKNVVYSSYSLFMYLFTSPPCEVSFAAYRKRTNRQPQDSTNFELKLTCVHNDKQQELTDRMDEKLNYDCLEEETAPWKMRTNDKAYPNIPEIERSKWSNDCFLEFYGRDQAACQKQFEVETCDLPDPTLLELYFHPYENQNTVKRCKMTLRFNESSDTEGNQHPSKDLWVEYCGIDFDTLDDLPEDIYPAVNELFSGNSRIQAEILDCERRWYIDGLKEVLSKLSKLKFNQVRKVMSDLDCLKSDAPNQHILKRLRLLQCGNDLISRPLQDTPSKIKEVIDTIATIISIRNCMKFGRELGMRQEDLKNCRSSSDVLNCWLCNYQEVSSVAQLFKAFRECREKDLATGLAKVVTEVVTETLL